MAHATVPGPPRGATAPLRSPRLLLHPGPAPGELERRLASAAARVLGSRPDVPPPHAGDGVGPPATPALSVLAGDRAVAHYLAVPEGPEEPPFRELIAELGSLPPDDRHASGDDRGCRRLSVFIAPSCPRCPVAVRSALALAVADLSLVVDVVDVSLFPTMAEAVPVRSAPTLVADCGLTVVGAVSRGELAGRLAAANGPDRDRVILSSLVETGRFAEAGRRLAQGRDALSFTRLWLESTLESRIALLLAAEQALGRDRACLDGAARALERGLGAGSAAMRGDTVDLLGRLAVPASRTALAAALDDPDPDVADAAAALEALDGSAAGR